MIQPKFLLFVFLKIAFLGPKCSKIRYLQLNDDKPEIIIFGLPSFTQQVTSQSGLLYHFISTKMAGILGNI